MTGRAFGVETPNQGETAVSWQTWSDGAAVIPAVDGDADWGKLKLDTRNGGEEGRSAVYDLGSVATRTFTLTENRYGSGAEDAILQIRASETSFAQDDATPAWTTYATPVSVSCRYVQIREITELVPLPQYFMNQADEVIEAFEDVDDWTVASGSIAANTTQKKAGTQSIKMTTPEGGNAIMTKDLAAPMDVSGQKAVSVWIYLHDTVANYYRFYVYLSNNVGWTAYIYSFVADTSLYQVGWNKFYFVYDDMSVYGAGSPANPITSIRIELRADAGQVVEASVDLLESCYARVPTIILGHADGFRDAYDSGAFAHMIELGIPGNLMCKAGSVGLPTYLTIAEYQELYAAGFSVVCHNYTGGVGLGDLTEAQQETEIANLRGYIQNTLECPGGDIIWTIHGAGSIYWDYNLETSFPAQGITMCNIFPGQSTAQFSPPGNMYNVHYHTPADTAIATELARIDEIIDKGKNEMWLWERLDSAGGMTTEDHNTLMDYIYVQWKLGLLYPITMLQYRQAQLGSIVVAR